MNNKIVGIFALQQLRFEPKNLITLCEKCHKKEHKRGGDAQCPKKSG